MFLVNAVAPGFIKTQMTDVLKNEVKEEISKNIPLKRNWKCRRCCKCSRVFSI